MKKIKRQKDNLSSGVNVYIDADLYTLKNKQLDVLVDILHEYWVDENNFDYSLIVGILLGCRHFCLVNLEAEVEFLLDIVKIRLIDHVNINDKAKEFLQKGIDKNTKIVIK